MPYWRNRLRRPLNLALGIGSVLYPGLVYFGQGYVSPLTFIALMLALFGLRLAASDRHSPNPWRFPVMLAAAVVVVLAFLDRELAVRVYPVLTSFGLAALFGFSLSRPPSMVERIARLHDPGLSPEAVLYCRRVTLVWTLFGLFNGAVAWSTAVWATLEIWTLWNGVIAYILIGTLFIGELMVRSVVRRKRA